MLSFATHFVHLGAPWKSISLSLQHGQARYGGRERRDDRRERRLLHAQEGLAAQDHTRQGAFMITRSSGFGGSFSGSC